MQNTIVQKLVPNRSESFGSFWNGKGGEIWNKIINKQYINSLWFFPELCFYDPERDCLYGVDTCLESVIQEIEQDPEAFDWNNFIVKPLEIEDCDSSDNQALIYAIKKADLPDFPHEEAICCECKKKLEKDEFRFMMVEDCPLCQDCFNRHNDYFFCYYCGIVYIGNDYESSRIKNCCFDCGRKLEHYYPEEVKND